MKPLNMKRYFNLNVFLYVFFSKLLLKDHSLFVWNFLHITTTTKLLYDCTIVYPFFLEGGESEDNEADNSKENNEGETVR